jgi:hypothetical protein
MIWAQAEVKEAVSMAWYAVDEDLINHDQLLEYAQMVLERTIWLQGQAERGMLG